MSDAAAAAPGPSASPRRWAASAATRNPRFKNKVYRKFQPKIHLATLPPASGKPQRLIYFHSLLWGRASQRRRTEHRLAPVSAGHLLEDYPRVWFGYVVLGVKRTSPSAPSRLCCFQYGLKSLHRPPPPSPRLLRWGLLLRSFTPIFK